MRLKANLDVWRRGVMHYAPTVILLVVLLLSATAFAQDEDRPYMGIRLAPDGVVGIIVTEVVADAPADAAGIEANDILVTIDGEFLTANNAIDLIGEFSPGDTASFELLRDDETLTIDVTFDVFPEEEPEIEGTEEATSQRPRLGVAIDVIDGDGALVTVVAPDTAADDAGIETGDIITAVDGEPIANPNELIALIGEYSPGDVIEITLLRDEEEMTLEAELGAAPADDVPVFVPIPDGITFDAESATWTVSGDALAEYDIENGDVITAINAETIENPVDAFNVLQDVILDSGATLTVMREDDELEIEVPVDVMISLAAVVE